MILYIIDIQNQDQCWSIYSQETASTEKLEWPSWTLIVIFVLITMSIGWIPFIALTVVSIGVASDRTGT